jgi:hypothetical protein
MLEAKTIWRFTIKISISDELGQIEDIPNRFGVLLQIPKL